MGFPDKKTIKKIAKNLDKVKGTKAFNKEDATPIEAFRFKICQTLLKKAQSEGLTNRQMAELCSVNETDISKIFHNRIERFSTDRLLKILLKAESHYQIHLKVG